MKLDAQDVDALQRALYAEGFLHQAPTGVVDDRTRNALRAWQTAQAREPTGALDEITVQELVQSPAANVPQGTEPPGSPQHGGSPPPVGGEGASSVEGGE